MTNPTFVKKYTKIGNSNIIPFARVTVVTVEINEVILIWLATVLLIWYDPRKLIEIGAITK